MSKPTFRAAALALAGILIAIGGCTENPSAATGYQFVRRSASQARFDGSGSSSSSVIDARGGTIVTPLGDQLVFPAGAVSQPTTITLRSETDYLGVVVEPHGLQFPAGRQPVLTLKAGGANVAGLRGLALGYVNEVGSLESVFWVRAGNETVSAQLPHFSTYRVIFTATGS
ncbi:MAG: hypothetical protein JO306_14025 [Gemmatimonadetes bacterium]|nr:hypothetical protein [Gemmatimonadota bacterium]